MAKNPNQKGYFASRHVDLLDLSKAGDQVGYADPQNNMHFLHLLYGEEIRALKKVIAGATVHDKDGNVRDNPAANIIFDDTVTQLSVNNVQDALETIIQSFAAHTILSLPDSATFKKLPGATETAQLNSLYRPDQTPVNGDLVFVGYDVTASYQDNDLAGIWILQFPGVWKKVIDLQESFDDRIQKYFGQLLNVEKAVTHTLTYEITAETDQINLSTLDILNRSWTLRDTAPFEGLDVYINGIRMVPSTTKQGYDYTVSTTNNVIQFSEKIPVGCTVQIDILEPPETILPSPIDVHMLRPFNEDALGNTGKTDGIQRTFSLWSLRDDKSVFPLNASQLEVIDEGKRLVPDVDYTVFQDQIIFNVAPKAGHKVWALYYVPANAQLNAAGSGIQSVADLKLLASLSPGSTPAGSVVFVEDEDALYMRNMQAHTGSSSDWCKIGGCGGAAAGAVQMVADMTALGTVAPIPGTLVYVLNPGRTLMASQAGAWTDIFPQPTDKTTLQALVWDPAVGAGAVTWEDDRDRPETVKAVSDLTNPAILPPSHLMQGKIVYVTGDQSMYEYIAPAGAATGTSTDWRKIGGGSSSVILAARVGNLPLAAAGLNAPSDNAIGIVRLDVNGNPENRLYRYILATDTWAPVDSRADLKALRSDPDHAGFAPGDVQTTLELGHEEIKVADLNGALHTIFSADAIAGQIAAGNQFQGTISDTGAAIVGAIQFPAMKAQSALQQTDKSHYWIYVGTPGYTIKPNDIGGAASAVDGGVLNVGDWIIVSDNGGKLQYNIIPGDLLAKSRGDNLYGMNTWVAGGYEAGAIVVYNGKLYKATGPVVPADPAPDQAGAPWAAINLSAGVSKVATDNDLPAGAANGDVYLVLSSAQAGGGQAMFSWDLAANLWTPIGGGAQNQQPMDLAGGVQIIDVGMPIGGVIAFGSMNIPYGWLVCDGSWINSAQHPKLVEVLNPGNNSAQLPDLRDQFIRGANTSLDRFTKHPFTTALPRNGFSTSTDGEHRHSLEPFNRHGLSNGGGNTDIEENGSQGHIFTQPAGGHIHAVQGGDAETAPAHVRMLYIIKSDDHGMGRL